MAKPLVYNATLEERIDLTLALAVFKVRSDEPDEHRTFEPGQYVTLGLNNEERPDLGSVRRPMSIASAPEDRDHLEFYIRYVDHPESDNPLTHLLWKTKNGDRLYMRSRPVGKFSLEHTTGADDPRLKVLVAAGTGLAPFLSMARSRVRRDAGADLSDLAILHGASYPADLGYRAELLELRDRNGLVYLPTVSRPHEAPDWTDDAGRVEDFFLADRLADTEARLGLDEGGLRPDRAAVLICGLQGTIGATIERLAPRGFVPENRKLRRALATPDDTAATIFFEQYDNTPVLDVADEALMARLRSEIQAGLDAIA